ncbi:MAG: hypothetical protein A2X94_16685 [Bdellovibrionales bacterium GWB1_55_8]|nr:MAG: hypothetical protein A2X94_16685 [Bdellovibrionales bacterium GWB1_55_8]
MRRINLTGLLLVLVSACGPSNDGSGQSAGASAPEPEVPPSTETRARYAEGWQEIEMIANFAKTKVGVAGHFVTGRNACGKEAYGALELAKWNALVESTNLAIKDEPLAEEYCIKLPEGVPGERYRVMDGIAEIKLDNGSKRTLFDTKGNETCTKIPNREAANQLITLLHAVVVAADIEDCPNGWGSG